MHERTHTRTCTHVLGNTNPHARQNLILEDFGIFLILVTLSHNGLQAALEIKNITRVTVNNDFFWSRVRWFANDFHEWQSLEWKALANHITSDKKSLFTVTNVLFYFLHVILCPEHTIALKNNHRSLISPLLLRKVFSDLALWRHHNWSMTSR